MILGTDSIGDIQSGRRIFLEVEQEGMVLVVDMGQLADPRSQYRSLSGWLFHSLLRKIIRSDILVQLLVYFFIY